MHRTEADMTIQKLHSGYWHVRFGPNQFVQWPANGSIPTEENTFGFVIEDKEDAALRAAQAVRQKEIEDRTDKLSSSAELERWHERTSG